MLLYQYTYTKFIIDFLLYILEFRVPSKKEKQSERKKNEVRVNEQTFQQLQTELERSNYRTILYNLGRVILLHYGYVST